MEPNRAVAEASSLWVGPAAAVPKKKGSLTAAFRRAFAVGLREYDFVGTDDPWKLEWTDTVRERVLFEAFRDTPLGRAEWAVRVPGRRAAAKVRRRVRGALGR